MASSPDYVRAPGSATRPSAESIFDALRETVLVVDIRPKHLPVTLANTAARRCFLGDAATGSLVDSSLYSLLGPATDSVVDLAIASLSVGKPSVSRELTWRFPRGEIVLTTELKMLTSTPAQQTIMLTFFEPVFEPAERGPAPAGEQGYLDLLILDKELTVTYANAGATRTAGSASGNVLGYSALTLAPTSAVPREAFVGAFEGHPFHDDAIAVQMPGAAARWFEVDVQPLEDASQVVRLAVLSTEVTDRHARARAARGGERVLRALTDHARDIVIIVGRDGKLQYVSGGVTHALGYTPEERRDNSIFEYVHPDDLDVLRAKFAELVAGAQRAFSHQYRVRHRDGSYRWLESTFVSAIASPLISGVVVNARDITDRRHAESRLAQREEVFRLAADAVNAIIFEWDLAQGVVHRSGGVRDVLGLDPRELRSVQAWSEHLHPLDRGAYDEKITAALHSGRGWTITYRMRDTRGRYVSLLERGLIERTADGEPLRAIGCCVDVSEIQRLTDLLAETQRTARMGGWEYNYATREMQWTDGVYRIYETSPQEFAVSWHSMMAQCPPDSRQRLYDAIARAEAGDGTLDLELEIITLRQRRLWVRLIGHLETLDGRPHRAFGSMQNIHAQKLSQIALETSTDWLKLSMNMAYMQAWRWNRATDTFEYAIADGQPVNLPAAIPSMKKLMSRLHRKDRVAVHRAIEQAFEHHAEVHQEFRLRSHHGQYRVYAAVARPLFDAANHPSGLVGVTQDVTARHESEARVRRSEELLRTTTANTADTLVLVDSELRIRFINRSVCGVGIEALVGEEIGVLLPEGARPSVLAKLRRVLRTAEHATYEYAVQNDGAEIEFFENRAVLVRDDGVGTGISITVRNITERRRLEQEILDVSSRERQTIGRDLHDGLGQELTGVALMLRGLATRIRKQCPDSVDQLNEIVVLVNQSIDTARALARGMLPVNTDGGGLCFALRALAERSRDLHEMETSFHEDVSDQTLDETTAGHLYCIAQEALTNTARHARASAADVYLTVSKGKFSLRVADNGVGIGLGEAAVGAGMGLKIMKYRASMIGAKFEVAPSHPHGTVICVSGLRVPATGTFESTPAH